MALTLQQVREVTASCRLTQGRTIYSSVWTRTSDGVALALFSNQDRESPVKQAFKDGTPSLCTQRSEDFLIQSSSHKQRNSRTLDWKMTMWNLYLCLLALCPWESLWTSISSSVKIGIIRGLLCGLNELIHTMFLIVFLALSKHSVSLLLLLLLLNYSHFVCSLRVSLDFPLFHEAFLTTPPGTHFAFPCSTGTPPVHVISSVHMLCDLLFKWIPLIQIC